MEKFNPAWAQHSPTREETTALFEKINQFHRNPVLRLEAEEICIFLPHCLRNGECPATNSEEGLQCKRCGRCVLAEILPAAEACGIRAFCVPGGSLVKELAEKYQPKGVLAVACWKEILLGLELLWDKGVLFQLYPLSKDGCFETEVDPAPLLSFLDAWRARRRETGGREVDKGGEIRPAG